LPMMVAANLLVLGNLERLIKPAVRQRTLRLSDSQDQHGRTLWIYDLRFMIYELGVWRVCPCSWPG
jgi:hypothetical protein